MESLNLQTKVSIQTLFHLERCGRYDEAIQMLDSIWTDKSALPDIDGFDNIEAAELLLRCGSLIGFVGYNKQIPALQENSRNILTKAREKFVDIYNEAKIAECENYLALTYTRKGETSDAQIWVDSAYSHSLAKSNDSRLYTHLIQSIITNTDRDYKKTLENFKSVESDFKEYGDYYLNGAISANIGIACKNLDDLSESIKYFELSRYYHGKSKHEIYLGAVENDIALIYSLIEDYPKAHFAIDNALSVFKQTNDKTKYGFTLDTKATIFIKQGKVESALDTINKAVGILEKSENVEYLVETLSTKTKILVKSNKIADASICLSRAIELARINISEAKANKLAAEFAIAVNETKTPVITQLYTEKEFKDENIELVFPPEMSHFEEIEGVWIKNKHLEQVGLKKGSLAIIVKEEVKRGDLIAVLERDSEDVICGFYDIDFGIICLEALDRKPQLFDENEIQILGKIVGVADKLKEGENKMHVNPIEVAK